MTEDENLDKDDISMNEFGMMEQLEKGNFRDHFGDETVEQIYQRNRSRGNCEIELEADTDGFVGSWIRSTAHGVRR